MKDVLIEAVIKVSYVEKNRITKKSEFVTKLNALASVEEKASYFYSFFTSKKASKADFAQELAVALEKKYINKAAELQKVLPKYLVSAIVYATKGGTEWELND